MSNTEIHLNPTEIDLSSKKSFPCPRFGEKNVAELQILQQIQLHLHRNIILHHLFINIQLKIPRE